MVAIAFDRYFCICMVSKNVMNLNRAKLIVICLIVISCLLGVIPSLAAITAADMSSNLDLNQSSNSTANSSVLISPVTPSYTCTLISDASSGNSTYYYIVASLLHPFKYCYDLIFYSTVIIITTLYIQIYREIYTRRKEKRKRKRQLLISSWINGGGRRSPFFKGTIKKKNTNDAEPEANNKDAKINTTKDNSTSSSNTNASKEANKIEDQLNKIQLDKSIIKRIDDVNEEVNVMETKFLNDKLNEPKESKESNNINATASESLEKSQQQNLLNASIQNESSGKRKRSINVISTKDIRTAFMLFVISFLFICFFSPSLILTYISLLKIPIESNLILTYLYFSNSAINPIVYCFLNPNFRADLIKLFFKRGSIYNTCTKHFNNSFK